MAAKKRARQAARPTKPRSRSARSELDALAIDWLMGPTAPLDAAHGNEEALAGLDRIEAWSRWARYALEHGAEAAELANIRTRIARIGAALANVRTDEHAHGKVDLRNTVIAFVVDYATSLVANGDEPATVEFACDGAIAYARKLAPPLAARLAEHRDVLRAAIEAYRANRRQNAATVALKRVLDADTSKPKPSEQAWREFLKWRELRRKARARH